MYEYNFDLSQNSSSAPHTVTMIQSGERPVPTYGTARGWAMSAVVLGCLYFLALAGFTVFSMHQPDPDPSMKLGQAVGSGLMATFATSFLFHLAIPLSFIAAGTAAVMCRMDMARRALSAIAAFAIVPCVAGYASFMAIVNNPLVAAQMSYHQAMVTHRPLAETTVMMHAGIVMLGVMGAFLVLFQIAYCSALCWSMRSPEARAVMNR
ncbi:MAG: hypothetical protein LC772_00640 [Chloroflexi bacterium]|nr:hypothetical protein [Chloroflexota bacterium]